jgi:hypothetical protein
MSDLPTRIRTLVRPFRKRLGRLAALLLAVLTLACSGSASLQSPGALAVVNAGTRNMTGLWVTPSSSSSWGPNQLAPSVLVPEGSLTLAPMVPDTYDVQALFADGVVDTVNDVRVREGDTAVLYMANVGVVRVVNGSGAMITGIYLVPGEATDWGTDQLDGTLVPGFSFDLTRVPVGTYDLRVVFLNETYRDYLGIRVDPATTSTITVQ